MERLDPVMVQLNGINGHNGLNGRLPNGQDHQLHRTLPHSMNYNTQRYSSSRTRPNICRCDIEIGSKVSQVKSRPITNFPYNNDKMTDSVTSCLTKLLPAIVSTTTQIRILNSGLITIELAVPGYQHQVQYNQLTHACLCY